MSQDAWDNASADRTFTREDRAKLDLADALKEWIEEMNPLGSEASVFSDLLNAALGEVDWYEIAENFLDDVEKDEEGETEEVESE